MLAEKLFTNEDDFQKLREQSYTAVELIDDVVYMSPAPTPNHQKVNYKISKSFDDFLNGGKCEMLQGINLRLYDTNKNKIGDVIPDISVFCDAKDLNSTFIEDIPVIVVEIVSPSSIYLDNFRKAYLYERVGISEYWIVDLKTKSITIWDFRNDEKYTYNECDIARSTVFVEFTIDLTSLF